jgi:hypothetical protein
MCQWWFIEWWYFDLNKCVNGGLLNDDILIKTKWYLEIKTKWYMEIKTKWYLEIECSKSRKKLK